MGTNRYVTKLKAQLDRAIIQREHWKQLAENRNSIVVTEVCPESRSVEEYTVDADSVRASWRLIRSCREQIEAMRAALLCIASVNPAERGIEWAKSYASDGLKGAGSELYARWLDTFNEAEALRAQVSTLQPDANSWQSGYDKGREDGAKAADGWKAQHARDSAELRRLCAERDHLKACQENAQLHITGLVAERNAALNQRDKLAGLLIGLKVSVRDRAAGRAILADDVYELIDAAIAELTP